MKCEYRFRSIKQYDKCVSYSNSTSENRNFEAGSDGDKAKKAGGKNRWERLEYNTKNRGL